MTRWDEILSGLEEEGIHWLRVDNDYHTPATRYQLGKFGKARITRCAYPRALYRMEGVRGYEFYFVSSKIPVTTLKLGKETWMVDDPLHWWGMVDIARACHGHVLVVGLGLGLIIHAITAYRHLNLVNSITVIEREPDVVKAITPYLPTAVHGVIEYLQVDYKTNLLGNTLTLSEYDTIVLDIWTSGGHRGKEGMLADMMYTFGLTKQVTPKSDVFIWGMKDPSLNPAVKAKSHL